MIKNNYILYNGVLMARESWRQESDAWVLSFEQGIRMDFFATGNRIPFLQAQLDLLGRRFRSVGWQLPSSLGFPELKPRFEKLLNRNRLFKGSLIRLLIIPQPESRELDGSPGFRYLASTEEREYDYFPLNVKGLSIGISSRYRNTGDPLYSSMVRSRIRSLLVREEAVGNGWDDILILDQQDHLSESSCSSLFIRYRDRVVTPSAVNNGVPRVIPLLLPAWIREEGLSCSDKEDLVAADLQSADEVFLADDLNGIRWVLSHEQKRYYRKLSASLSERLAERMRNLDQFHIGSSG